MLYFYAFLPQFCSVWSLFRNKKDAYGRLFLLVEGLEAYEGEERKENSPVNCF